MKIAIIGAGGVGGWVASALAKTLPDGWLLLVDKDKVEDKNLSRQLFDSRETGKSKASSLAARVTKLLPPGSNLKIEYRNEWFMGVLETVSVESEEPELLINVCDNHTARLRTLELCDERGIPALFGANEAIDAEGYVYKPEWKDTDRDPRIYYPELFNPDPDDPTRTHCEEEAELEVAAGLVAQTPIANFMAGAYLLWLLHAHFIDLSKPAQAYEYIPYRINNSSGRVWSTKKELQLL